MALPPARTEPKGTPLIIEYLPRFEGTDGPWSTIPVHAGHEALASTFNCVPALSQKMTILPMVKPSACNGSKSQACLDLATYDASQSQIANDTAVLPKDINPSLAGFDDFTKSIQSYTIGNVTIGPDVRYGQTLQWIAGANSLNMFLGVFGLGITATSNPDSDAKSKSLIQLLYEKEYSPSLSFGYTAGSFRKNSNASLIFGGYDTSRCCASRDIQGLISQDDGTLPVKLHTLYGWSRNPKSWVPIGSPARFIVDSVLPEIWLPIEACNFIEDAFGIKWDDSSGYYLLDNATHDRLVKENPSLMFAISGDGDGQAVNLTIPYSALDLQLLPPLVDNPTYYFPLKRASKPSQYLLGRAFLQETYIVVDYHRGTFNLSQAQSTGKIGYVLPITPPNSSSTNTTLTSPGRTNSTGPDGGSSTRASSGGVKAGAYAGIGVGSAFAVVIILAGLLFWKRRKSKSRKKPSDAEHHGKPELNDEPKSWNEVLGKNMPELVADDKKHEACGSDEPKTELEAVEPSLEAGGRRIPEGIDDLHEMYAADEGKSSDQRNQS